MYGVQRLMKDHVLRAVLSSHNTKVDIYELSPNGINCCVQSNSCFDGDFLRM